LRDGVYGAVVTMTTVGYGDKTPKTAAGRVIAIAWMLVSVALAIFSPFDAAPMREPNDRETNLRSASFTLDTRGSHVTDYQDCKGRWARSSRVHRR
jgi:hypothetical protein